MNKFDLEDRFIDFTIRINKVVDEIDNSKGVKRKSNLLKNYRTETINSKFKEISFNYERNWRVNSYNLQKYWNCKVEHAEIMKIEYCILSVECLIPMLSWHLIATTTNNIEPNNTYMTECLNYKK